MFNLLTKLNSAELCSAHLKKKKKAKEIGFVFVGLP